MRCGCERLGETGAPPRWPGINPHRTPPRHSDVDDRAEDEEHDELGKAAFHGIILRHIFPSPAAMVIVLVWFGILVGMAQPGLVEIALICVAAVFCVVVAALVVFGVLWFRKRKDD